MEVMHQSHEALLTILEVLLYDPLYVWTMSPQRACQLQQWREMRTDVTAADVSEIVPSGVDLTNADEQKRSGEYEDTAGGRSLASFPDVSLDFTMCKQFLIYIG